MFDDDDPYDHEELEEIPIEGTPAPQLKGPRSRAPAHEFQYRKDYQLAPPITQNFRLEELIEMIDSGRIELNPEYQRDVVWSSNQMSRLIDSVFDHFYIPPVIFNNHFNSKTGDWTYICVDGKQRLSSVRAFMKGEIPCLSADGTKWYYGRSNTTGKSVSVLSEEARRGFGNKTFMCFIFSRLSRAQEEDLFQRVQKGVPLNGSEKLRAIGGSFQTCAKRCEADFGDVLALTGQRVERAGAFRLLLIVIIAIAEINRSDDDETPVFPKDATRIEAYLKKADPLTPEVETCILKSMTILRRLVDMDPSTFKDIKDKYTKAFTQLEFVATVALIHKWRFTRNHRVLLGDILELRWHLRKRLKKALALYKDQWAVAWSFIVHLERHRGSPENTPEAEEQTPHTQLERRGPAKPAPMTPAVTTPATITRQTSSPLSDLMSEDGFLTPNSRPATKKRTLVQRKEMNMSDEELDTQGAPQGAPQGSGYAKRTRPVWEKPDA